LYDQAVVRLLEERFRDSRISYLLLDARSGAVIDARWLAPEQPVPAGSLVKPFTALAYGEAHDFAFPEFTCRGAEAGCWLPRGHGRIGIVEALAHSCNAYFDALAAQVPFTALAAVARRFSIAPPPENAPPGAYTGRDGLWQIAPLALVRAYAALFADRDAAIVLDGLAECARTGTGRAAAEGLAKTGTAPCVHRPKAAGDGYAILADRAVEPARVLLVRVHGAPGAEAAATAGAMMRIVREGR
jgi:hypothetical protein